MPVRRSRPRCVGSSRVFVRHRIWPANCCRPTSSMSCHRKPKPAHGAPSPWRGHAAGIGGGEPRLSRSHGTIGTGPRHRTEGTSRRSDGHEDEAGLGLLLGAMFVFSACTGTTPSAAPASQARPERRGQRGPEHPGRVGLAEPAGSRPGRGGHPERRTERRDRPLDVLAVADVRRLHQGHDHPVRRDLPGRQGQLGRSSGDLPGRPQELVRGRQRPGRHQPVGRRGLGVRLRHPRPAARAR